MVSPALNQVYLASLLQQHRTSVFARLFEKIGFWETIKADPFSRAEWLEVVRRAPAVKEDSFTVLSTGDALPEVEAALQTDEWLAPCFVSWIESNNKTVTSNHNSNPPEFSESASSIIAPRRESIH